MSWTMRSRLIGALVLAALGVLGRGDAMAAAQSDAALMEGMQAGLAALDASENYKSPDSGNLAWGEAYVLTAFYYMYEATGDTAWLDRIVKRADVVFANLSPGEDGYPGWRTPTYSVALVETARERSNTSTATVKPDPARIYDIKTAQQVTGHDYDLRVTPAGGIDITDTTTGGSVATITIPDDGEIEQIPGVKVVIEGKAGAGDRFIVKTTAPKPLEYVVHDGMILTPIANFCAAVLGDRGLTARYGDVARRYLKLMEEQLIPKWERWWRDLPDGAGVYTAQNDVAQRYPGASLPHNQYLALARTHIALYRITGKQLYRERAERMGRLFKTHLRLVGGHYEWNYWDRAASWDTAPMKGHVEDSSHGHIDIAFAVDAYDIGIVFDRQDMQRFARTITEAMWNGNQEAPRLGSAVDTSQGDQTTALDWIILGRFSSKTREVMLKLVESLGKLQRSHVGAAAEALAMERLGWSPAPRYAAPRAGCRQ